VDDKKKAVKKGAKRPMAPILKLRIVLPRI
jgi:hypothetical protein